jgi:mono/diheme cytochrome c family protein
MKQNFVRGLFVFFIFITVLSCKHYPPVPPAEKVCFSRDILPLMQSSCAQSGCHDAQTREHGIYLGDYDGISDQVRLGRPDNSDLYKMITEKNEEERMPPLPYPRLSQEQIDLIRKWIEQGAENTTCESASCDTVNVTFTKNISPILQQQCLACHSNAGTGGGILLDSYENVKAVAADQSKGAEGKLYGAIAHFPAYSPMPKSGNQLDNCKLRQVRLWIDGGMPQ